jgi:hypothetical protein
MRSTAGDITKIASGLVVFMFPAVIFFSIFSGQANNPVASLSFLVLGLIVASILLSPRGVVILAFVNLFGITHVAASPASGFSRSQRHYRSAGGAYHQCGASANFHVASRSGGIRPPGIVA